MTEKAPPDYESVKSELRARPGRWLVTGCAGFIGSHIVEALLRLNQTVIGLDNFSSGGHDAVERIERLVSPSQWARFDLTRGDIRDMTDCRRSCERVDRVLHHAAVASVPGSIQDPLEANGSNVDGFLNMLVAARDVGVKSFVFASSSAVYGDAEALPTSETVQCAPLSPYAAAKRANELYAAAFSAAYDFPSVSLRYFNCFGGRQRADGPYASVIPLWLDAITHDRPVEIFGDGSSRRDYVHIADVIQANILASMQDFGSRFRIFNIGSGVSTSLRDLHACLCRAARIRGIRYSREPSWKPARVGDIRHSSADISRAVEELGYVPRIGLEAGLKTMFTANGKSTMASQVT